MEISTDIPITPIIPCGHECISTFWEISRGSKISILSAKRYTLLNNSQSTTDDSDAISNGPITSELLTLLRFKTKANSEEELVETLANINNAPHDLKNEINKYFRVRKRRGFLKDQSKCASPCHCKIDFDSRNLQGEQQEITEMSIQYERRREMLTAVDNGSTPTFEELIDPMTGQPPGKFDRETDEIKLGRRGINGDQRWDIVTTYFAIVKLDVTYMLVTYSGACKEPQENG